MKELIEYKWVFDKLHVCENLIKKIDRVLRQNLTASHKIAKINELLHDHYQSNNEEPKPKQQ